MIGLTSCPTNNSYYIYNSELVLAKTCNSIYVNIVVLVFGVLAFVFSLSFMITMNSIISCGIHNVRVVHGMPMYGMNGMNTMNVGMYQPNMMGQPQNMMTMGQPMQPMQPMNGYNPYNPNAAVYWNDEF